MASRNVDPIEISEAVWDSLMGEGDPQQRYRLGRLCPCEGCGGTGRDMSALDPLHDRGGIERCSQCRGEGRVLQWLATVPSPEALGVALVELSRQGEFADCPPTILDTEGETGEKWIVKPWQASPRNVSDAARTLARSKGEKKP